MEQIFLSIAVPVNPEHRDDIERELDALGNLANPEVRRAFGRSLVVHFMSATLVPGDGETPDHLIFEISGDGTEAGLLSLFDDRKTGIADQFDPVLELAGKGTAASSDFLAPFIVQTGQGLTSNAGVNFPGTPWMSVKRIRDEWAFARKLREICHEESGRRPPLETVNAMRDRIADDPEFAHMKTPVSVDALAAEKDISFGKMAAKIAFGAITTFLWPVVVAGLIFALIFADLNGAFWHDVWELSLSVVLYVVGFLILTAGGLIIWLLQREADEPGEDKLPDPASLAEIRKREDQGSIQNHLFAVSEIKPGILRYLTLRLAFYIILAKVKLQFRPGYLGDIGTIHFARWFIIPKTNKLVFCSNFGGSWESYLEDFITKASEGLSAVWSNTTGFPKTQLLFLQGAAQGDKFKRWARRQQIPTRFWYCAYPQASTARIRINAAIRRGFYAVETEDAAAAFLAQFSSRTRPEWDVETGEIQTLMFGALRKHPQSTFLFLRLPDDTEKARGWLRGIADGIDFGAAPKPNRVGQIAFTATGIAKLGLEDTLDEYPFAFTEGMHNRSRILLDSGNDSPDGWKWGNADRAVDAVFLLYLGPHKGRDDYDARLAEERDALIKPLQKAGGGLVEEVLTTNLSKRPKTETTDEVGNHFQKEPFGFVDGVSQPAVRGMRPGAPPPKDQHLVEPGEFVLGYPDNRGAHPHSPSVDAAKDNNHLLPVVGIRHDATDYPVFEPSHGRRRDLGRNGTFLAMRQLRQDVGAFKAFKARAATETKGHPGIPAGLTDYQRGEYLAAKMVGRWQDGTSMIRFPNAPGSGWDGSKPVSPDNDFLLGRDDPTGAACPFGSHVRRTNPRESFTPSSNEQITISNRHRILRRGRFYGAEIGGGDGDTGLMFICANADLERQFEFVQQTWIMARQFHGLENEIDPVLGRSEESGRLTIPTPHGPIFLNDIPDMTQVIGGGYFFMPSRATLQFMMG